MNPTLITVLSTIAVATIGLIGTVYTSKSGTDKLQAELDKHNAIQDTKLEELTREVRQHNDFATRIPILEHRVNQLEQEIHHS